MRKGRMLALVLSGVMLLCILPNGGAIAADTAADKEEYQYFLNTDENSAYVTFGETVSGKNMEFIDGLAQGITDSSDPLYNELVTLDGLQARKQYSANSSYLKVSDEFYDSGDTEFLVSIVFYDFGPSEGKYYFEYHSTEGGTKQVMLIKPGTNPGWAVRTLCVDDVDLSAKYDNGATVRIVNGAYNAFKKVEIVNVSKARREKQQINVTCLGDDITREFSKLCIYVDSEKYANANLSKQASAYDVREMIKLITGDKTSANTASDTTYMTQGEMLRTFMDYIGVKTVSNEDTVSAARRLGVVDASGFFLYDEAPATRYNLLAAAYGAMKYENSAGEMLFDKLIESGYYDDIPTASVTGELYQLRYFAKPKKLPYETITDPGTGRSFNYINFFGSQLIRPYLSGPSWTLDGKQFACGLTSGAFYLYNIETQMMTYVDNAVPCQQYVGVVVCGNGWLYYVKSGAPYTVWRANPDTLEKEQVFELPSGVTAGMVNVTDDGKYASIELWSYGPYAGEGNKKPVVRLNLETGESEVQYHEFEYSHILNHLQINPVNPDLIGFAHETDTANYSYTAIYDRVNTMDMSTGEVYYANQGRAIDNGEKLDGPPLFLLTHEMWSHDGKYRYCCAYGGKTEYGGTPAIIRMDADGSHPQYFSTERNPWSYANHAYMSADNKMFAFDDSTVSLMSAETRQIFPICQIRTLVGSDGHPNHAHPHIAVSDNLVNWGYTHKGVLGVAWMDYTDILEREVAKGGRYAMGEYVTRVSYKGLECESYETKKNKVECCAATPDSWLYLDVNSDIADGNNCAVKLTFDYFDNTNGALKIAYTKGVETYNDALRIYNKETSVVRGGTNKWKTAEIVFNSINLENIGEFESDFKIKGIQGGAFITNVKVERLDGNDEK